MEKLEKWCVNVKCNRSTKDHPVIKYLNATYGKSHDGTAYYYGVLNGDSFCDSSDSIKYGNSKQSKCNIPILTLEEFEIMFLSKPSKTYELW